MRKLSMTTLYSVTILMTGGINKPNLNLNHVAVRFVQKTITDSCTRCHQTFVTQYESQQEEECEENFRKNCFIEYEKIAFNETVES